MLWRKSPPDSHPAPPQPWYALRAEISRSEGNEAVTRYRRQSLAEPSRKEDCFFTNEASKSMKTKDTPYRIREKGTGFCTELHGFLQRRAAFGCLVSARNAWQGGSAVSDTVPAAVLMKIGFFFANEASKPMKTKGRSYKTGEKRTRSCTEMTRILPRKELFYLLLHPSTCRSKRWPNPLRPTT